jgi:hypothetical protein
VSVMVVLRVGERTCRAVVPAQIVLRARLS